MKIVLIGSESFIGREVRRQAEAAGHEWCGVDLAPATAPGTRNADIRSPDIADAIPEGADAIIHLAAISRDQDCRKDPVGAFEVNVMAVVRLIQAARQRKARQFIFASSEWVYGNSEPGQVQREDDPIDVTRTTSEYALTKIVGERMLHMAFQQGFCATTILRFGIVYGPRPQPGSAVEGLFQEVRTLDEIAMKGSLSSGRRFIHVSDISAGILKTVGRTGIETFNLSGDRLITFREIIAESAKLLNRSPRTSETDPKALNVRNPDNSKAKRELNWQPRIGLVEGLQSLLDFQRRSA